MLEGEKKSPLERLKKGLYSRTDRFAEALRHDIHEANPSVPTSWEKQEPEKAEEVIAIKKTRRVYSYVFLASLGFFIIAALIAGYTLFGGKNFISVDNVDILIEGPSAIGGGQPLSLSVSVVNKNATDIQLVDLIAEFPEGTKDSSDPSKDVSKVRLSLGDIASQSVAQKTLSSILFGEEGAEKEIKFTAEYRTADSNAVFYKEKSYIATISSSPVNVSIKALDKVLGGQASAIEVTVTSNSAAPIKNLLLSMDYPFGFTIESSSPASTYGNSVWKIGDLAPGAKRVIVIRASTEGQDEEERTIRANVGIQSKSDERVIATTIISRAHTFSIERAFLGLDLTLNGIRGDLATEAGRSVRAEVIWTNNTAERITGARIEARLSGNALDKASVRVDGGYYDSSTNTIVWEAGRVAELSTVAPGEDGRVGFSFSALATSPGQAVQNPLISVAVSARGSRVDGSGAPQEINTGISRAVKLVSNLALSARSLRSQGPFRNEGPIPPLAEATTTYTIMWTVTNTSNSISGARVTATMPQYVAWTGLVSPEDSGLSYHPESGQVVWNVGSVPRNANIGSGAKQISFQVAIRPSQNQVGSAPELIGQATIVGTDTFAGVNIQNSSQSLSTRTTTDLLYKPGDDIVQK